MMPSKLAFTVIAVGLVGLPSIARAYEGTLSATSSLDANGDTKKAKACRDLNPTPTTYTYTYHPKNKKECTAHTTCSNVVAQAKNTLVSRLTNGNFAACTGFVKPGRGCDYSCD